MGCGATKSADNQTAESPMEQPDTQKTTEYVPPDDFPTPRILTQCQDEYAERQRELLQQGGDTSPTSTPREDDHLPEPCPPEIRKIDLFDRDLYADVREAVLFCPKDIASSVNTVAEHLMSLTEDTIGRLYASFCWVVAASQNLYKFGLKPTPDRDSVLYQLLLDHSGHGLYNTIFMEICRAMDFTINPLKGQKKSVTEDSIVVAEEWSWLVVLVDARWHFIDVDFAISVLEQRKNDEEDHNQDSGELIVTDKVLDKDCDFYFLTDPDEWIFSHFAPETKWQMLAKPVTYSEFKQMAHLTEVFFTIGFKDIKEATGVLASQNGKVMVDFTMLPDKFIKLDFGLELLSGKENLSQVNGEDLMNLITLNNEDDHKIVDITLIEIGRYWLKIWATDVQTNSKYRKLLGHWYIDCQRPAFVWEPNPHTDSTEYGLGAEMKLMGLNLESVTNTGGFAHVKFSSETCCFDFIHSIESNKVKKSQLRQYARHYIQDKQAGVIVVFPEHGKYVLNTYIKPHGSKQAFKHVCSLLLIADVGYADLTPFPQGTNTRIGKLTHINDKLQLTAVSHTIPYIKTDIGEALTLKFHSGEIYDIMAQFDVKTLHGHEDASSYVWPYVNTLDSSGYETNIEVSLPFAGMCNLSIFARKTNVKSMVYREVYKYIIVVDKPQTNCLPYPIQCDRWDPSFMLISPKHGYLQEQQDMEFSVRITGISEIFVFHSKSSLFQNLQQREDSLSGQIKTLNGGNDLTLAARFKPKKTVDNLLEYVVLSTEDWENFQGEQQLSQNDAKVRLEAIDQRREEQAQAASKRKDKEQEMQKEGLDEFENNKEELFENQARLQEEFQQHFNEQNTERDKIHTEQMDPGEEMKIVKKEIKKILEAHDPELRRRRKLYKDMVAQITRQKLKKAIKDRHLGNLQTAVKEYHNHRLPGDEHDVIVAERLIEILTMKQDFASAMEDIDIDALMDLLDDVTVKGYHNALQSEVIAAQELIRTAEKRNRFKDYMLDLERKAISEVRSYSKPPVIVQSVVKAVLLLLGEDEGITANWGTCSTLCNPYGVDSLHVRRTTLDIDSLHPEIVSRANQMLAGLDVDSVKKVSTGIAAFFVWAVGIIDEFEATSGQDVDKIQPANLARQRELLGKFFNITY